MRYTTLSEWLDWLESLHPKTIDLGLERVRTVGERLGILNPSATVITVGGTNGKGSCVAFLSEIYQSAGYQIGAYTSPHLLYYNERIVINGNRVSDDALMAAFSAIDNARGDISLTYFEFGTLAAFWLFFQQKLDVWILEVGLGGRLDAVNIIDNDVAIIASIDLDHMEYLGSTREQIGYEKAGIFRENKCAVVADDDTPVSIIDHAKKINTNLYVINKEFCYHYDTANSCWSFVAGERRYDNLPLVSLKLSNACASLMTVELLQECLPVSHDALCAGLKKARVLGRFWQLSSHPTCIVDVAHNPAAAKELAKHLKLNKVAGKTVAVVGILQDKDIRGIISALLPVIDTWYLASLSGPRGSSAAELALVFDELRQYQYQLADTVAAAYKQAVELASRADRVVVFGSFLTVAQVISLGNSGE